MDLHDQPSTSRAACSSNKSQHKVIIAEKNRMNKQKAKPKAPAPRWKKKKNWVNNELKNLVISLDNEQSKQDDDETSNNHDTTGVRRSKRGHVPLQISNWVYSISGGHKKQSNRNVQLSSDDEPEPEPEQMPLQDKVVTEPKVPSPKKKRGIPKGSCKRYQQLNSDLRDEPDPEPKSESEQLPLQDKVVSESKVPSPKTKRARRYQQLNSDSEDEPEPESELEQMPLLDKVVAEQTPLPDKVMAEPMSFPEQKESALIEPSPVLTDGEKKLLQYTSYLRGASDEPFSNADNITSSRNDNDNTTSSRNESAMHISAPAYLKFKLIKGIEYSFFDTEDKRTVGYMRFPPFYFERTMNKNKLKTVRLIVVYGEFDVVVELDSNFQTRVLKLGEMVEIKMGVPYNIINRLSECSVIMVQLIK